MTTLTPCTFCFDDGIWFVGLTDGTTWNGYDNVWITPQERDRMAADFAASGGEDDEAAVELRALVPDADGLVSLANGWGTTIIDTQTYVNPDLTQEEAQATLDYLTGELATWLAQPAQAPLAGIQGDAEDIWLTANQMIWDTPDGAQERALRGATKDQAMVWAPWLYGFIIRWEKLEQLAH